MTAVYLNDVTDLAKDSLFSPPVAGVTGLFIFGQTQDNLLNRITGQYGATTVGNPTYNNGYATFAGVSGYLQSDILESDDQTIITVGRALGDGSTQANRGSFYGTFNQALTDDGVSGNGGTGLYQTAMGTILAQATRGDTTVESDAIIINNTQNAWALYVHETPNTLASKITNETTKVTGTSTNTKPRKKTDKAYRIGSSVTSNSGSVDVGIILFCNKVYSEYERKKLVDWIRNLATARGIAV